MSALVAATACSFNPPDGDVGPDGPAVPVVQFELAASDTDEAVTSHLVKVVLSEPSTSTVDFVVLDGGLAKQGMDYAFVGGSSTGTLTFAGDTAVIELTISDDGLEEGNEDIQLELRNPQGATLGDKTEHVVTISADILPRVKFTNTATNRDEDVAGAKLDLEVDIPPTKPLTVELALSGNATAVADFGLTPQTVTFGIGQMTAQLDYGVIPDLRDENNELVAVDLTNPVGAVIDTTASHTEHTIEDDDATPTVFFTSAGGAALETVGDRTQTVQLSALSNLTVTVDYTQTGSAVATDVTVGGTGTLTFAPGEMTQTIPVTVLDDTRDEANETVVLTLSNPDNASLTNPQVATVTITDDDDPPQITFGAATSVATEGGAALVIPVNLTGNVTEQTVTVDFSNNVASTATITSDFTFPNGTTLTFAPGVTTQNIAVTIVDDAVAELDETLIITLSNFGNATAGAITTHTVTISDNDCLGSGNFRVCANAAANSIVTLTGVLDTDSSGVCAAQQPLGWTTAFGQPASCFVIADQIRIVNAAGIRVTGGRPLVLAAKTSIALAGVINAAASQSTNGPAGPSSLCAVPAAAAESSDAGGGGGAGASFMVKGGNGGNGDNNSADASGSVAPNADAADPAILRGGCAGADGGSGPGEAGSGGGGGGAVYLVAPTITLGSKIDVSGGGGGGGAFDVGGPGGGGGGGGGGAGGSIFIDAMTTLTFSGTLMANGGGGGQGADVNTSGDSGADPTAAETGALGGNATGAGGKGGNGFPALAAARNGTNGPANGGAGGGGGAGGFIKSTKSLANGTVSAGKVVQ